MVSIITPHRNDFLGILSIFNYLGLQTCNHWEWIIVDDCSDEEVQTKLTKFIEEHNHSKVKLIVNQEKTTASFCRNKGAQNASFSKLVFLDSDDKIAEDFVENRIIHIEEFSVFLNFNTFDENNNQAPFSNIKNNFLENFLKAKFAWQTSAILWEKDFFFKIGMFDTNLILLEDIEISIRALLLGKNYKILNNDIIDFFYFIKPVNINVRSIDKVSTSVNYFLNKLFEKYKLTVIEKNYLGSYYFLNVRYLVRSNQRQLIFFLKTNLILLYKNKAINILEFRIGNFLLASYKSNYISDIFFLKWNRIIFKK